MLTDVTLVYLLSDDDYTTANVIIDFGDGETGYVSCSYHVQDEDELEVIEDIQPDISIDVNPQPDISVDFDP